MTRAVVIVLRGRVKEEIGSETDTLRRFTEVRVETAGYTKRKKS